MKKWAVYHVSDFRNVRPEQSTIRAAGLVAEIDTETGVTEILKNRWGDTGTIKKPERKRKRAIGDRYRLAGGEEYLLALTSIRKATLIDLQSGNRMVEPIEVVNAHDISDQAFRVMLGAYCEIGDVEYIDPK